MSLTASLAKFFNHNASNLSDDSSLRVLVGVSGGADSIALLHALVHFQKTQKPELDIRVAHLNHCLRGEASDADAGFVTNLAESFGLPVDHTRYNVQEYASHYGLSLEAAARAVRYSYFASLLTTHKTDLLLVAHTANDQAETIMLHLLRGSGPKGLSGMAESAPFPLPATPAPFEFDQKWLQLARVGRPLLEVWRTEIEAYCTAHHLQPRFDQSNADTAYLRNRIRLELLPLLEREYQPGFMQNLIRLGGILQSDEKFLADLSAQALERVAVAKDFSFSLDCKKLIREDPALQARLLRLVYQKLAGTLENLESLHIELLKQAVQTDLAGWSLELPGGIVARKTATQLHLSNPAKLVASQPQLPASVDSLAFTVNNETIQKKIDNGWSITARIFPAADLSHFLQEADRFVARLDYDKVGSNLQIRVRQAGEKFQPLGAPGHRKLQDVLLDAKIPRELRSRWPIVALDQPGQPQIVWVAGYVVAEPFKLTDQTSQVLELRLLQAE